MSPPARGRGLKRSGKAKTSNAYWVAPCAGAWIETFTSLDIPLRYGVAPCAGAWIETCLFKGWDLCVDGRPLRGGVD